MKIAYNPITENALTQAPTDDIIFDLAGLAIFAKGVRFDGVQHSIFRKYDSNGYGYDGLVPAPSYNEGYATRFLSEDGEWLIPIDFYRPVSVDGNPILEHDNDTLNLVSGDFIMLNTDGVKGDVRISATYQNATQQQNGLMSSEDKEKLDGITPTDLFNGLLENAFTSVTAEGVTLESCWGNQNITLSQGQSITIAANSGDNSIQISGNQMIGATAGSDGSMGLVPTPYYYDSENFLKGDGTWSNTIENSVNASNSDTIDGYHIVVGAEGSDPNTIYFVL